MTKATEGNGKSGHLVIAKGDADGYPPPASARPYSPGCATRKPTR